MCKCCLCLCCNDDGFYSLSGARARAFINSSRSAPAGDGALVSCRLVVDGGSFFLLFCVFLVVFTPATTSVRPSFGDGAVGRVSVVAFRSN